MLPKKKGRKREMNRNTEVGLASITGRFTSVFKRQSTIICIIVDRYTGGLPLRCNKSGCVHEPHELYWKHENATHNLPVAASKAPSPVPQA